MECTGCADPIDFSFRNNPDRPGRSMGWMDFDFEGRETMEAAGVGRRC